ncbi:MAG: preprotein translocase subunit SecG [Clostridiales bacterium]|nr:preprotein translocase subunit SecG [Clostridiales bacterium]MBQ2816574.1 preprotein translocase subunit SecG [Clostridia bacterium]MBQ4637570.1 preprotein translocase subunit SecG [Clostridia bacterium]
MGVLRIILTVVMCIVCLGLIVLVLLQPGKTAGLSGAITGGAETFFGKQKAKSMEGKLALYTKIGMVIFVVLAIILTIIANHI